jgi:hypothetical protein
VPGIDHPVHPSTQLDTSKRRWCFNRDDFKDGYFAPNGLVPAYAGSSQAHVQLVFVPDRSSRECRYDQALKDPACRGCRREFEGHDYALEIERRAKEK